MRRRLAALVAVIVLLACSACVAWLHWSLYRTGTHAETRFEVAAGAPMRDVLLELREGGLLPSVAAGRLYLRLAAHRRSFRFGVYTIPAHGRPVDVLEQLLDGRVQTLSVTIVEGSSIGEVSARFCAVAMGSPTEWDALTASSDWISDLAPTAPSLEGFLFPDTYRFAVGTGAQAAARHLVHRFRSVWEMEVGAVPEPWGSPLQVVTLASLVEAETSLDEERSRVAGVFFNRLQRGMLLQCDPTVVYALERRGEWNGRLLRVHWEVDDPYNTYRYPGLPPGPINSPGRAAIAAALHPERHAFLYFVAQPGGGHAFSRTLEEHNRAVARLLRSRR